MFDDILNIDQEYTEDTIKVQGPQGGEQVIESDTERKITVEALA